MAKKPVTVGIIGCGTHGRRGHHEAHLRTGALQLVAVCDPGKHITRARDFTKDDAKGVQLCRTEDEFYAVKGMDAVIVCSPDRFHTVQLLRAVHEGKHVLVDKPAAATAEDLGALCEALRYAAKQKIVISSCHPRRFNPAYVQMKTILPEWVSYFGPATQLMLDFSYHVPDPARVDLHTGMLADHLNHEADFLRFLFGRCPATYQNLLDEKDRYEVAGIRTDGIAFHFSGTRRLEAKIYPETVRIRFERGEVTLYTKTGMITEISHETTEVRLRYGEATNYEVAFDAVARNFAAAIRGKEAPYLSHDDIIMNSKLCALLTDAASITVPF
jgi:predicted dehydrogenase